jgi:hypothetical protein
MRDLSESELPLVTGGVIIIGGLTADLNVQPPPDPDRSPSLARVVIGADLTAVVSPPPEPE